MALESLGFRIASYLYMGASVQIAFSLGLQHEVQASQSPLVMQRSQRIWWTLYILDQEIASRSGSPSLINHRILKIGTPVPSEQVGHAHPLRRRELATHTSPVDEPRHQYAIRISGSLHLALSAQERNNPKHLPRACVGTTRHINVAGFQFHNGTPAVAVSPSFSSPLGRSYRTEPEALTGHPASQLLEHHDAAHPTLPAVSRPSEFRPTAAQKSLVPEAL